MLIFHRTSQDCFFVNVVVRDRPEHFGKAVAVSWGQGATAGGSGTAEISSANYEAREFGVAAGMFVREAKRRCPELVIVNYDFAAYEEVSLSPWMANREIGSMTWTILFWSQSALDFCAPIPPKAREFAPAAGMLLAGSKETLLGSGYFRTTTRI
jgi:hypothetical protein